MKHYLSFGGGVNSVALHLLLLDKGIEFETIFSDHGGDLPETYAYFEMFQEWLMERGHRPIQVITPNVEEFTDIYEYYWHKKRLPSIFQRDCTKMFKLKGIYNYIETPCFMHLGIDYSEQQRAVLNSKKSVENRYLLIEEKIDREGCKQIILDHGLPLPIKSGCFFCPFMRKLQVREIREKNTVLFERMVALEKRVNDERIRYGSKGFSLFDKKKSILEWLDAPDRRLKINRTPAAGCMCERMSDDELEDL
jgi:hypothetical protein